jgi:Protein of unknown function (DUF1553)/Protein of unknown function (DUF1549)/Planctomycete cytochrome C
MRLKTFAFISFIGLLALLWFTVLRVPKVDFITEIKPILNNKCMKCHGGVKETAGYNLLTRDLALRPGQSGKAPIVPGDPDASDLMRRLTCLNVEERMPYQGEPLSETEVNLFRNWIKQGADWGDHWAYLPVKKPEIPTQKTAWSFFGNKNDNTKWGNNNIDAFVLDKLKKEKLTPAPEADKYTLLRRVALDLTGIPASDAVAAQFLQDSTALAYGNLVDSLLASPAFGERWAAVWMDVARYADTKGYERDAQRFAWRYRDWLVRSFNKDQPYDQFLIEQLAGDLLPNPDFDQLTATQFHRNTPTNDEGGTVNEEFRVAAVLDRVNTTWEGLMGTTFACVQCHSHPYDPFFHEEYYKFSGFFNNTRDADTFDDFPLIRWYSGADSLKYLEVKNWLTTNANPMEAARMMNLMNVWQPVWYGIEADSFKNVSLLDEKHLGFSFQGQARLPNVTLDDLNRLIIRYRCSEPKGTIQVHLDKPDGAILTTIPLKEKTTGWWAFQKIDFPPVKGKHDLFLTFENPALVKKPEEFGVQFDWFAFTKQFPGKDKPLQKEIEQKWYDVLIGPCETSPCMWDNPTDYARKTHIFERGNWLVHGKEVTTGTPTYMPPMPENAPNNRLGMAQWITAPENPLTARVMVNRLWEQLFGIGLVETMEDFGTQGAAPSHPELLDYMAWSFREDKKWSMKQMLREMVLSATYRQSAYTDAAMILRDPNNRFLARGARVRLSGEQIRDQALAISGLLSSKMYGKPVMPYQPEGIWAVPWNGEKWQISKGEDKYRRALYTFWKRSSPYPAMITFDAATRQVCSARRVRTNTPLQALVTLNDPVYVSCAKFFALRILKGEGENLLGATLLLKAIAASATTDTTALKAKVKEVAFVPKEENWSSYQLKSKISAAYRVATGRSIPVEKSLVLENLYLETLKKYAKSPLEVTKFLKELPLEHQTAQVAALAVVSNVILNLDEIVTKE